LRRWAAADPCLIVRGVSGGTVLLPQLRAPRSSGLRAAGFAVLSIALLVGGAGTTVASPQLGAAYAVTVGTVVAFVGRAEIGVVCLWVLWLLGPGVRRVFGLELGYTAQDPLAVAPFLATALIGAIILIRTPLRGPVRWVLAAVLAGFLLGLPSGLVNPTAAAFGLVAYVGALGGLLLGWREGHRPVRQWTLFRVLAVAAPALALYGCYQYFVALPAWDEFWLDSVEFESVGAPEEGKIRIFSTVNSPGVLAFVLSLTLLLTTVGRRLQPTLLVVAGICATGLALTYVRSAWVGLVVAALIVPVVSRGRALPQLAALAVVLAVAAAAIAQSGDSTFTALSERVNTFSSLDSDISANARQNAPAVLIPELLTLPFGHGLGSAGEATRLAEGGFRAPDNGYLSMLYQLGLPGGLLVIGALLAAVWVGVRSAFRRGDPDRVLLVATFAFVLVLLVAGDQFYGLPGVIVWFLAGAALARASAPSA